jgi:hypothetical protein
MENVLRTIKSEVVELNKKVAEEIAEYKKQIEDEIDAPVKELLTKMLRCDQMFFIFQLGVINEVKDIVFFRNAIKNLITCETELTELVNEQVGLYNVEEECYLTLCNYFRDKYKPLKKFLVRLEDANLHPERYNY